MLSMGKHLVARFALLSTFLYLSACTLGPQYSRPEVDLPTEFRDRAVDSAPVDGESVANIKWWEFFQDQQLQGLVRVSLAENRDLRRALARIDEARAVLGFTQADQYPRLDGSGNASRTNPSNQVTNFSGTPQNDFGLFGDLSFEIDLWGRVRRATEAEQAQLLSTEYAQRFVALSLVSQVASSYFILLDLDNRLAIAERTISNRRGATKIIGQRVKGGTAPDLDLNQAQIEEEDAVSTAIGLRRQIRQTENALNVLLGRASGEIPRGDALSKQKLPDALPTGFPAALLERRPDLLSNEEFTRSLFARIGVAEAERFPRLDLLGFVGLQSSDISDFVDDDAFTWSIGGNVLGPIVDFGKSKSRVEIADAQAAQALNAYEQSVFVAVREVDDALIAMKTFREEIESRRRQLAAAKNAARLSRARYDDGVTSYLEVLDSDRSYFDAELNESLARQQYLVSIVQLYRALGGGWEM